MKLGMIVKTIQLFGKGKIPFLFFQAIWWLHFFKIKWPTYKERKKPLKFYCTVEIYLGYCIVKVLMLYKLSLLAISWPHHTGLSIKDV
jgi:hypothetical protein